MVGAQIVESNVLSIWIWVDASLGGSKATRVPIPKVHILTKCSLVQTYPLNSWEIPMMIIHFMISHLGLKSNKLIMSFFLKKFTNHCIATLLFTTNASFVVNKFGFVTCSRIWFPLSSPPCILGPIGNHYIFCIISQCKSYAKLSIKLPILPTPWAPPLRGLQQL